MATSRLCSIPACDKPAFARGYCNLHHHRWRRFGDDVMEVPPAPPRTSEGTGKTWLFLRDVAIPFEGQNCLLWPFALTRDAYGKARCAGKGRGAHRIVCEIVHGAPPSPLHEAAHSCGNSSCVNPRHIRWATSSENAADQVIHGTRLVGETHPNAKIDWNAVAWIRSTKGLQTNREAAAKFGVSPTTISMIRSGYSWKG